MKQQNIIFKDEEIVEFCRSTEDTNEIHDPEFMSRLGKRLIVPGMFALGMTINMVDDFLKNRADTIRVLFNSLLCAGDFATLLATENPENPDEIRLSAINHRDTLNSKFENTKIFCRGIPFEPRQGGILRRLKVNPARVEKFKELIRASDPDVAHFLFAIAYASHALLRSIDDARTDVEREINTLINGNSRISPFYQSLEIHVPRPFPLFDPGKDADYYIDFVCEKSCKLYTAYVRCEQAGGVVFYSKYQLVGIPDVVILRMAKEVHSRRKVNS